jgi:hypothetical protein
LKRPVSYNYSRRHRRHECLSLNCGNIRFACSTRKRRKKGEEDDCRLASKARKKDYVAATYVVARRRGIFYFLADNEMPIAKSLISLSVKPV